VNDSRTPGDKESTGYWFEPIMGSGLKPSQLNLFWAKGVFGKTHLSAFLFYFTVFCFDI
jgi:hypothetical protein